MLGREVVDEMLSRDLDQDPLTYEQMQDLKKCTSFDSIKKYLRIYFRGVEKAESVSDIVDIIIHPDNRIKAQWENWGMGATFAIIGVIAYCNPISIVEFVFYSVFNFISWHSAKKIRLAKIKNVALKTS